jgi:hypothetical protein
MLCDKSKIVYLVNSKVACTSIKQAILEKNIGVKNYTNYSKVHEKALELGFCKTSMENYKCYYSFTFVRNPFSRIVSLYVNKFLDKDKIAKVGFEYENYLGGIFHQDMSFLDFISIIANIPDKISEKHFMGQAYLIKQVPKLDYIGKLENIKNDYETLSEKFSLPELHHVNKSPKYNYKQYLCKDTIEIIYKRYKNDFRVFDYLDEYHKLKATY